MDKFESLRAFVQVVEAGGFAAAARHLGRSRSAVNKLVMHLEDDLKVQLLHRTTRKVTPTATGLAFYQRGLAILADLKEAELAVSQMQREPKGRLRINAPMSFGTLHLAPALTDFLLQYPDLHIELTLSDRFIDPIEEGFDVTLRIAQPPESASLIVHELMVADRVVCASPEYLKQYGVPQTPADLKHHSCLHYGHFATSSQWTLTSTAGNHTVTVNGVLCSNNGEVLRTAALQGLGIALLPTFIVGSDLLQGTLCQILADYPPPEISAYVLYPVNRHLSAKVQLLTEFLQARLGDRPA
ncbi:MAG: LysR family transcriptional regulator [Leptolyngbyaceae cyanobacterium SL_1_1]|nr:LysR family transcriptional regulator [Leptolyngbyaceae cyanobacterium RM1_1_2]NJO10170.1 LysR family transcriptional regulator [Leptolyngbyaceae cyanobacterium SL_1_1]